MANHASVRLPWAIDPSVMELFASQAMRAVFGSYYEVVPEEGSLAYRAAVPAESKGWRATTSVWSDSNRHVEMRRNCRGLDQVAQGYEFESLCAAFGAGVANDDGIGDYLVDRPGSFALLSYRGFCGGLAFESMDKGTHDRVSSAMNMISGRVKGDKNPSGLWMLSPAEMEVAQKELDPVFFNPPRVDMRSAYQPGPGYEAYVLAKRSDSLEWGTKLNWAAAVESAYPQGVGMTSAKAFSALMPSAALGIECPKWALEKASAVGLQRALSVALLWMRPDTAKAIHARLMEVSSDPAGSEAKARAACVKFLDRRARVSEGEPIDGHKESCEALFESLVISRCASASQAKPAVRRPQL